MGHLPHGVLRARPPPGLTVTVEAECVEVKGRKISFRVRAHDGVDQIGEGRRERAVVAWEKFNARVAEKAQTLVSGGGP